MKTPTEIKSLLSELNNGVTNISADLVTAFEKYQRNYERELFKTNFATVDGKLKATIANYNKAQSLSIAQKLGFNDLAISTVKKYDDVAKENLLFNKRIGITTSLTFKDLAIVKQLKELDLSNLWNESARLEGLVKRQLVNAIATESDLSTVIDNLSDDLLGGGEKLGALARYSETYIKSGLFDLGRMVDQEIYADVGGDEATAEYAYYGPLDDRTSDICLEYVGEIKTREEWESIGDAEGYDIFTEGLHFNCRHRLILVPPEEK